jgi:hypothetical protein
MLDLGDVEKIKRGHRGHRELPRKPESAEMISIPRVFSVPSVYPSRGYCEESSVAQSFDFDLEGFQVTGSAHR